MAGTTGAPLDDDAPRRSDGQLDGQTPCDEQLQALCEKLALALIADRSGEFADDSTGAAAPGVGDPGGAPTLPSGDTERDYRRMFDEALRSLRDTSSGSEAQDEMLACLSSMRAEVLGHLESDHEKGTS